jgi:hypothetical protein
MKKTKIQDAIQVILDSVNGGNQENIAQEIFDVIRYDHRTLQQAFWSTMLKAQIKYADCDHDLRNESAVKLAGLVKETAIKNNLDMGLPRI